MRSIYVLCPQGSCRATHYLRKSEILETTQILVETLVIWKSTNLNTFFKILDLLRSCRNSIESTIRFFRHCANYLYQIQTFLKKKNTLYWPKSLLKYANVAWMLLNTYKHHLTEAFFIVTMFCPCLGLGLFMSYLWNPFFIFIFISTMINTRIILWKQTHSFFCCFLNMSCYFWMITRLKNMNNFQISKM